MPVMVPRLRWAGRNMKQAQNWRLPGRKVAVKAIVLGSAAALAVTGAQASGLPIAGSVDYVRVCDAFGTGYWSLPATDGCIRLHEKKVKFRTQSKTEYGVLTSYSKFEVEFKGDDGELAVTLDQAYRTRSKTKYGVLTSYSKFEVEFDGNGGELAVKLDHAYIRLGGFLAGHTETTFGYGGAFFGRSLDGDR